MSLAVGVVVMQVGVGCALLLSEAPLGRLSAKSWLGLQADSAVSLTNLSIECITDQLLIMYISV